MKSRLKFVAFTEDALNRPLADYTGNSYSQVVKLCWTISSDRRATLSATISRGTVYQIC